MTEVARLRCFNHGNREAVARCPVCARTFCRECVTEHEDRIICAQCLAALGRRGSGKRARTALIFQGVLSLASFIFLWAFFYYLGRFLLSVPSTFHEPFQHLF